MINIIAMIVDDHVATMVMTELRASVQQLFNQSKSEWMLNRNKNERMGKNNTSEHDSIQAKPGRALCIEGVDSTRNHHRGISTSNAVHMARPTL